MFGDGPYLCWPVATSPHFADAPAVLGFTDDRAATSATAASRNDDPADTSPLLAA